MYYGTRVVLGPLIFFFCVLERFQVYNIIFISHIKINRSEIYGGPSWRPRSQKLWFCALAPKHDLLTTFLCRNQIFDGSIEFYGEKNICIYQEEIVRPTKVDVLWGKVEILWSHVKICWFCVLGAHSSGPSPYISTSRYIIGPTRSHDVDFLKHTYICILTLEKKYEI